MSDRNNFKIVSKDRCFNNLCADNLKVLGDQTVCGDLKVGGNSTFESDVVINKDANIVGNICMKRLHSLGK